MILVDANLLVYAHVASLPQHRLARKWLDLPRTWVPVPTERHREVLEQLMMSTAGMRANLVPDAHLAALAIEHGLVLCSSDGDFARFPGLRWENPL